MNYRHAFHAGNFADLIKHASLLVLIDALSANLRALRIIDTHAGRGLYNVGGVDAGRSGEAKAGIGRLSLAEDLPNGLALLSREVEKLNPVGVVKTYPGSPYLIAGRLRVADSYLACELRPEEHSALSEVLKGRPQVKTICADGFDRAATMPQTPGRTLFLIDPPFERADDYARIAQTVKVAGRNEPDAQFLIWLPIKDLETLDSFCRSLEDANVGPILVLEARMRPLTDPMKMNGCALVFVGLDVDITDDLRAIADWVVSALGDGGEARLWQI